MNRSVWSDVNLDSQHVDEAIERVGVEIQNEYEAVCDEDDDKEPLAGDFGLSAVDGASLEQSGPLFGAHRHPNDCERDHIAHETEQNEHSRSNSVKSVR